MEAILENFDSFVEFCGQYVDCEEFSERANHLRAMIERKNEYIDRLVSMFADPSVALREDE